MFEPQVLPEQERDKRTFGLTWYALRKFDGLPMWNHGGGDPGISTAIVCLRDLGVGAVIFTNTAMTVSPDPLIDLLLRKALSLKA